MFGVDLDTISIRKGEFENFSFSFSYNNYEMTMLLSATEKNAQFNFGEGGMFDVLFLNPHYPESSFLKETFFYNFIKDKEVKVNLENIFGKDEKSVEYAIRDGCAAARRAGYRYGRQPAAPARCLVAARYS